jgi:hypothetical protein
LCLVAVAFVSWVVPLALLVDNFLRRYFRIDLLLPKRDTVKHAANNSQQKNGHTNQGDGARDIKERLALEPLNNAHGLPLFFVVNDFETHSDGFVNNIWRLGGVLLEIAVKGCGAALSVTELFGERARLENNGLRC